MELRGSYWETGTDFNALDYNSVNHYAIMSSTFFENVKMHASQGRIGPPGHREISR